MNSAALKAIREMATAGNILGALKAQAAAQVEGFPQYANHFNSAVLVRVTVDIKTKMGLAFAKDEWALLLASRGDFVTIWSMRNKVATSVRAVDLSAG